MKTIRENNADIREVLLRGVKQIGGDVDHVLCLSAEGGSALVVRVMLFRDEGPEGSTFVELDDCLPLAAIPEALIPSGLIQEIAAEVGPRRVYDRVSSIAAVLQAKLEISAEERDEHETTATEDVLFTLTIGAHYRSETTLKFDSVKSFLKPA